VTDAPSPAERPAARWAALAVRAAGTWILLGCAAKAVLGTPGDLPKVVQDAPFPTATTFAAVLAIEAFVGVFSLLRPARAWPLTVLLLLAFVVVLGTQVASGAASCGCFGGKIDVPPWLMLAIDAGLLALVLAAKPWRLRRQPGRADLVALVAALVVAAVPAFLVRPGGALEPDWYGVKEFAEWRGKRVVDTPLASWATLGEVRDGVWLLYKDSCEVCADCLDNMSGADAATREVTLWRLPETGQPVHVRMIPSGPWVHRGDLRTTAPHFRTPVRLLVEGGVVTSVTSIESGDECP
jgi:hypothetical protein